MAGEISPHDLLELLFLENMEWTIAQTPFSLQLKSSKSLIEANNLTELNAIIASKAELNIITNKAIETFFTANKANINNIDMLIIYTQLKELKLIENFIEQANLANYVRVSCSLTPIKSFLAPLDNKQQKIYLPFVEKLIEIMPPKTILTTDSIANLLKLSDNIIFPIQNMSSPKDIWFSILALKQKIVI